jgi:hypothetical protein
VSGTSTAVHTVWQNNRTLTTYDSTGWCNGANKYANQGQFQLLWPKCFLPCTADWADYQEIAGPLFNSHMDGSKHRYNFWVTSSKYVFCIMKDIGCGLELHKGIFWVMFSNYVPNSIFHVMLKLLLLYVQMSLQLHQFPCSVCIKRIHSANFGTVSMKNCPLHIQR